MEWKEWPSAVQAAWRRYLLERPPVCNLDEMCCHLRTYEEKPELYWTATIECRRPYHRTFDAKMTCTHIYYVITCDLETATLTFGEFVTNERYCSMSAEVND